MSISRCFGLCAVSATLFLPLLHSAATFTVIDADLSGSPVIIAYGDTRFTNTSEHTATNPVVRRWLVDRVAEEKPDAVLISGDLPWHGANPEDYVVFKSETKIWRDEHVRIYPALGNHELYSHSIVKNEQAGLDNWWNIFPELRPRRWYSVQLGSKIYALNLDSNSSLREGSEQRDWIEAELRALPASTGFVFVNLHHPPVADYQRFGDPTHNPQKNEIVLAKFLEETAAKSKVRFVVIAGHIHNYERFLQGDVVFLVSGGGGAAPRAIHRGSEDLYQDKAFPNYHYIKFVLQGDKLEATMWRVADPEATTPSWEDKDHFAVPAVAK